MQVSLDSSAALGVVVNQCSTMSVTGQGEQVSSEVKKCANSHCSDSWLVNTHPRPAPHASVH